MESQYTSARRLFHSSVEPQHVAGNQTLTSVPLPLPPQFPLDFHFIGIPRTGGEEVMSDSPQYLLQGQTLHYSGDTTFPSTKATHLQASNRTMAFALLRSPMNHVLSQYLECKYSGWARQSTNQSGFPGYGQVEPAQVMAGFDEWAAHFVSQANLYNPPEYTYYSCYEPWNMMARYFTMENTAESPLYSRGPRQRFPLLSLAKSTLQDPQLIVGITEYYSASMCLLQYHALQGNLSETCRTCDTYKNKFAFEANPAIVPPHSIEMITNETTLQNIQTLTAVDQELYEFALKLFHAEIDKVEELTGVDLLCRSTEPMEIAAETITQPLFLWVVIGFLFVLVATQLSRRTPQKYPYKKVSISIPEGGV